MSEIEIVKGYVPGAIGRVAELHGIYYHDHWGFGLFLVLCLWVRPSLFCDT